MTGLNRHITAGIALALLFSGLSTGCTAWQPRVAEEIPAQVCTGNGDTDMDGITDCNDRCPNTLRGEAVDPDGCPLPMPEEPKPYRG